MISALGFLFFCFLFFLLTFLPLGKTKNKTIFLNCRDFLHYCHLTMQVLSSAYCSDFFLVVERCGCILNHHRVSCVYLCVFVCLCVPVCVHVSVWSSEDRRD